MIAALVLAISIQSKGYQIGILNAEIDRMRGVAIRPVRDCVGLAHAVPRLNVTSCIWAERAVEVNGNAPR